MQRMHRWAAALVVAGPLAALAVWVAVAAPRDQTLNVTGSEYTFAPDQIFAQPGEPLTVNFSNVGQAPHNIVFELDNARVEKTSTIQSGGHTSISFAAPVELGRYTYYCSIGNHRVLGMSGTLRVEAPQQTPSPHPRNRGAAHRNTDGHADRASDRATTDGDTDGDADKSAADFLADDPAETGVAVVSP